MKCVSLCVVLFCAVGVYGYPQRVTLVGIPHSSFFEGAFGPDSRTQERDVDLSASEGSDERGLELPSHVGTTYDDGFYPASFSDIMRSMQEAMYHMRREMDAILHRLPESSDEKGEAAGFDDGFPITPDFDLSKGKNESTSKTEVIDGHLVTVNNTEFHSGDDNHKTFFRIKTIFVHPNKNGETSDKPEISNEPEPTQKPEELPVDETDRTKNDDNNDNNDIPREETKMHFSEWDPIETENGQSEDLNEFESTNDIEVIEPNNAKLANYDLSRDTLVNDYVSDQRVSQGLVMINPDAEFIDVDKDNSKEHDYYRYESQPAQLKDESSEQL